MSTRTRSWIALASGAFLLAAISPSDAEACSPPPDIYEPSCSTLIVSTPAASFPMNLVDEIVLERFDSDASGHREYPDDFPLAESIEVLRQTADGYAPVPFELRPFNDTAANEHLRRLSLTDPEPGSYVVSWQGESCSAIQPPSGSGVSGHGFDLGKLLPVPDGVGTLTARESRIVERQVDGNAGGGECETPKTDAIVGETSVELSVDPDVLPWAEVVHLRVYVDGEYDYSILGEVDAATIASGVVPFSIHTVCSSDEPAGGSHDEGTHQVTVWANFMDGTTLETEAASVTLSCEGADDSDDGCSVVTPGEGSQKHAPWAFVAVAAILVATRRRRSSRVVTRPERDAGGTATHTVGGQ